MLRLVPALALLLLAFPARGDDLSRYSGRYAGCAVSGDEWVPITTTLSFDDTGLTGSYVFIETPGRAISGTLAFLAREANGRLAFSWADIYGVGEARFAFSANNARFDGYWTGGGERYPWNGVREGSGLPKPDCSIPVA